MKGTDLTVKPEKVPYQVLYAGGTIGSFGTPLAPLTGPEFKARAAAAGFTMGPAYTWVDPPLDSPEATPVDWIKLAERALQADAPMIVLHGTDTMAWSAAAMAFLTTEIDAEGTAIARHAHPIVFTGSQLPLFRGDGLWPGSDAPDNLALAEETVQVQGGETWVAFGGRAMPGARVTKVSTTDPRAFDTPNGPGEMPVLPVAKPDSLLAQLTEINAHIGRKAVVAFRPVPNRHDLTAQMVTGMIDTMGDAIGALHLLGYGLGNIPAQRHLNPVISAARDRGVLVAISSQIPHGLVDPSVYDTGHWLAEAGALATGDMQIPAAQAKLHIVLALAAARGWDVETSRGVFLRPIAGEITLTAP